MMPSVSKKQHNFMAAVAESPKFSDAVGVSASVGKEFMHTDLAKSKKGGKSGTAGKPKKGSKSRRGC